MRQTFSLTVPSASRYLPPSQGEGEDSLLWREGEGGESLRESFREEEQGKWGRRSALEGGWGESRRP